MTYLTGGTSTIESSTNNSTANVGGITTLSGSIDDTATTIAVNEANLFPTSGYF